MTTNNRVKAPRPCTLLGKTFPNAFDLNIKEWFSQNHDENEPYEYGFTISTYPRSTADACQANLSFTNSPAYSTLEAMLEAKTIAWQTIASAQRPWLKAEGFEFDTCVDYIVLCEPKDRPYIAQHHHTTDTGEHFFTVDGKYTIGAIVAFKPISDTQEAWDAVAGVEVYKESTNDTQTNG